MYDDYSSPVWQVRLLMSDIDAFEDPRDLSTEPAHIFTDDQIVGFLDIEGGNVKRAAASALLSIAVSEALILKVIKTDDKQTDGSKLADALRAAAKALRDQAREDEVDDTLFHVVGYRPCPSDWAWR